MDSQIAINSHALIFCGTMNYEEGDFANISSSDKYRESSLYKENEDYYRQKYYPNWLNSIFLKENVHHFHCTSEDIIAQIFTFEIPLPLAYKNEEIKFQILDISIHIFSNDIIIFAIKIILKENLSLDLLSKFSFHFRNTTVDNKNGLCSPVASIIQDYIISHLDSKDKNGECRRNWKKFSTHLKVCTFVDIDKIISEEKLNILLFDLGTLQPIGSSESDGLFSPSTSYFNRILTENVIAPYKNWKTLCLFDTLTRVSLNLDEVDKYKLWEKEYILIYIYDLFTKYYLYQINNNLAISNIDKRDALRTRDQFVHFINNYDNYRISYKFLPNLIHNQFRKALEINDELEKLEKKIERINIFIREKEEKRIERILIVLTILSLISILYDGGDLIAKFAGVTSENPAYILTFRIAVLTLFLVIASILLFRYSKKR